MSIFKSIWRFSKDNVNKIGENDIMEINIERKFVNSKEDVDKYIEKLYGDQTYILTDDDIEKLKSGMTLCDNIYDEYAVIIKYQKDKTIDKEKQV